MDDQRRYDDYRFWARIGLAKGIDYKKDRPDAAQLWDIMVFGMGAYDKGQATPRIKFGGL